MEQWRKIKGFQDKYEVSDMGRVRSFWRGGRILTQNRNRKFQSPNYVVLYDGQKMKNMYVSRLVWDAFREWPDDPQVCYINNISQDFTDNSLENLECLVMEKTEDYDPTSTHRKGLKKPKAILDRMTESKMHQSEETRRKQAESLRATCIERNKKVQELKNEIQTLKGKLEEITKILNDR